MTTVRKRTCGPHSPETQLWEVKDGVLDELSANLTLPDCVSVARFYRELSFARIKAWESKQRWVP
jgi:hypothetical protein